jgi:hypothetical protein
MNLSGLFDVFKKPCFFCGTRWGHNDFHTITPINPGEENLEEIVCDRCFNENLRCVRCGV